MSPVNSRVCLFFALALGVCASHSAQTAESTPPGHVKVIPAPANVDELAGGHAKTLPVPSSIPPGIFDPDRHSASARSIRILSEDQMTREDRDLLANAESSIQERAGVENLEFNESGWTYHQ